MIKREFLDGQIVVYNADCLDVMREIGNKEIDLVLTDPPYGIKYDLEQSKAKKVDNKNHKNFWKKYNHLANFDLKIPEKQYFDILLKISKNQIIWGGNYFSHFLDQKQCWLVWNKGHGMFMADAELAWTSFNSVVRVYSRNRTAAHNEASSSGEQRLHPTQKPISLMSWCLNNYSKENDLIFDGFLGSGTTAISCIRTKRRLIGCELDPIYFEKLCERIETELRQGSLF